MWPCRSGCAAPGMPLAAPFPRGPCACGQGEVRELPGCFGSLLPPRLSFGSSIDALAVTWHRWLVPARMWGLGSLLAAARPSAPCSVPPAPCPPLLTWQIPDRVKLGRDLAGALEGGCQWIAVLRIDLGYLKSNCVGDVNTIKCVNGRNGSFIHLDKTFINYLLIII